MKPGDTHKVCSKCRVPKLPGEFPRDKTKKDNLCPQCKACRREYRKVNAVALAEARKLYKAKPESRYKTYKDSARYRGFAWDLSYEGFMKFWRLPCVYCGDAIETIGLDRIDPTKPYEAGNVEACCRHCNRMKSDLTREEFYEQINRIVWHTMEQESLEEQEKTNDTI